MLRTARQKKKICSICPFAKTADLIGDSVTLLIVRDLFVGPKRFGDLEKALAGVSTRTLSLKLKQLEEEKIITRTEYLEKPPKVEYSLTKKGVGLHGVSRAMIAFGKKYL
ncbi:MAG: helix-turn-helix domain-containing protein [bacterium]